MPKKGEHLSESARAKISAARSKPQADCICLNCNNSFQTHQSEIRRGGGKYCCKKCEGEHKKGVPRPEGFGSIISEKLKGRIFTPEWKAKISASLTGKPSNRKGKTHSTEAIRKMSESHKNKRHTETTKKEMSENRKGNKNSCWRGGVSFGKYCPKFNNEFKERVRAFFDYKCIECESLQSVEKHSVHHIQYNKETCCDDTIPMFAPLCRSCHAKTNFNRNVWEEKYAKIITEKYGGKSFLTKEEMRQYTKK